MSNDVIRLHRLIQEMRAIQAWGLVENLENILKLYYLTIKEYDGNTYGH